jgi:hypothetical protein
MKKFLVASVLASVSAPVFVLVGFSLAAAPAILAQSSTDQITIKDPAEFNSYQNAITQTDPKAKAAASESFLTQYPQSVVKKAVLDGLLDAYAASGDQAKTVDAAQRLLQLDPNNLKAMYLYVYIKKQQAQATPAQAPQLLDDAAAMATKGLSATKPAEVKDEDFKKQKATTDPFFLSVIASDELNGKKDLPGAVAAFRKELQYLSDNNPDATKVVPALNDTLLLGQTYTQLTPPDMVNGVWFLARAENFAPANYKPIIDKQAKYWYKRFHGKDEGFDAVLAKAATSIFPPADFAITPAPTPKDIADGVVASTADLSTLAVEDKEYVLANASKENAEKLWATVKDQTTLIPPAVVIAATASQIQLAVTEDAKADKKADFTVNMKAPLADKDIPAVGAEVKNLIGTYDSYTQAPAQIILRDGEFQVEKKAVPKKPTPVHHKAS